MASFAAVCREAWLSLRAQKLGTLVTLVLVIVMCLAVLLSSGRADGSQQAVLATIDSAGTRSIVVRAMPEAGLESDVLERFSSIDGVEVAIALGSANDVRNVLLPDGELVPLRDFWGEGLGVVNVGEAVASRTALDMLGMRTASGSVITSNGLDVAVIGQISDPSFLSDYEPLLFTPRSSQDTGPIGVVVIITSDATLVGAVTEVIRPIVSGMDASKVQISSSGEMTALRGSIDEQLGAFGLGLTAGALVITGALVAVVQSALVLLKRKDWGRRRALGASRPLIVALMVTQAGIIALVGVTVGVALSCAVLLFLDDPLPSPRYMLAVSVLAVTVSLASSLLPAIIASRRDPIQELRVP